MLEHAHWPLSISMSVFAVNPEALNEPYGLKMGHIRLSFFCRARPVKVYSDLKSSAKQTKFDWNKT